VKHEVLKNMKSIYRICQAGSLRVLAVSVLSSIIPFFSPETANAASCHFYGINIQGAVASSASSQPFSVSQYAMWRDTGVRSNPIEFVLTTLTDLNVSPQLGQILLLTNSAFANNLGVASASFDLAQVAVGNGVVQIQVDPGKKFDSSSGKRIHCTRC
jgi:hypothetical protein